MFTVRINKLKIYTKIGVSIQERKKKQLLLVSIKFSYKVNNSKNADNISNLISYTDIKKFIKTYVESSRCQTLEKLITEIKDKLKNQFTNSENILITRERHRQNLEQCIFHLKKFEKKNQLEEFDMAAEDLRLATRHLGMIVGKVDVEEILGSIFNDFCIGK